MFKGKIMKRMSAIMLIAALCVATCAVNIAFANESDGAAYVTGNLKNRTNVYIADEMDEGRLKDNGNVGYGDVGYDNVDDDNNGDAAYNQGETLVAETGRNDRALEILKDRGIPMLTFGDREIPLRADGVINTWALANLIMAIIGLICAILVIIHRIYTGRNRNRTYDADDYGIDSVMILDGQHEIPLADSDTEGLICTVAASILAALSVLLFVAFENMRDLAVMFDRFSIVIFFILAAEIVLSLIAVSGRYEGAAVEPKINIELR
jgi:hypothetical protein